MFRRIKILCLLQMSDKYKVKKLSNLKEIAKKIALWMLKLILIGVLCYFLTYLITDIMMVPKTVNLLIFILLLTQLLSIFTSTSGLLNNLYTSKDNMILLAYPATHLEVFLSKIIVYYIYELIKDIFFLFPLFLGFGIALHIVTFGYVLSAIVMTIIMPLFPVLIGALITIPIIYIKRFLTSHMAIKGVGLLGLFVLLFYFIVKLMNLLPVPLRIVAIYHSFIMGVTAFISKVNSFALFYNNIGNIFFGNSVFINYLIVLGVLIGLIVLVALISMPLYFRLASKSREESNIKKHKGKNICHTNLFFTFLRKEWTLSIRDIGDFVNNYAFLVAMPYVLYIMAKIYTSIDRNMMGEIFTLVFLGFIALLIASASNTSSAMAITKEGSEFVLIKTSPGKTSNMAWAKILVNLVASSVMIFISFLLIFILCPRMNDALGLWLIFLCVLFVNAGLIFWSFEMDITKPKLQEYATTGSIANLKNFSRSILVGFIVSLAFGVLSFIFLYDNGNIYWSWGRVLGFSIAFLLARLYLFQSNLKAYFNEIEY